MTRKSRDPDPFDLLRQLNPVDPDDLPGPDSPETDALLARIWATIDDEPAPELPPRLLGRRLVVALAVLSLLALAAAMLLTRDVTESGSIACFQSASLDSSAVIVAADGRDPVQICSQAWDEGAFTPATTPPALVECVLPTGGVGVFPVTDCTQVTSPTDDPTGRPLPPADQEHIPAAADLEQLRQLLVPQFLDDCIPIDDAITIIEGALDNSPFTDWTVQPPPQHLEDRPCTTLSFQPDDQTILLVPVPE